MENHAKSMKPTMTENRCLYNCKKNNTSNFVKDCFCNNKVHYSGMWTVIILSGVVSCLTFPLCVNSQSIHKDNIPNVQTVNAQMQNIDPKKFNYTRTDEQTFWDKADKLSRNNNYVNYEYDYDIQLLNEEGNPTEIDITGSNPQYPNADIGCPFGSPCAANREDLKFLTIEKVKRKILDRLNLDKPPNITIPKVKFDTPPMKALLNRHGFKVDRYNPYAVETDDPRMKKNERIISTARPVPIKGKPGAYFQFSQDELDQTVTSAMLWLYILPNPTNTTKIAIHLWRYHYNATGHLKEVKFDTRRIKIPPWTTRGKWIKLNVKHEVSGWFKSPKTNLGIIISSDDHPELLANDVYKPMVEVELESNIAERRRRSGATLTCNEHSAESRCCRYNFAISFDDLDWGFVIAPKVFNTFYCSGECPFMMMKSGFKRMLMQAPLVGPHSDKRREGSLGCCSPVKQKTLSMLYFDNNQNVVYSDLPDMIVEECGCL